MASSKTQAVAARIPTHLADRIRQQAQLSGVTVSDVVSSCIRRSLESQEDRELRQLSEFSTDRITAGTDDNADLEAIR